MIDVAEGEKIPRKGGPGIMRSDLLVINKIDLAPYVGADLGVMERDARRMRGERPFVFTNLKTGEGADDDRPLAPDRAAADPGVAGPARARRPRRGAAARLRAARQAPRVLTACRFILPLQVLAPIALDDPAAIVSLLNPTGGVLGGDRLVDRRHARRGRPRVRDHAVGDARSIASTGEPAVQTVRLRLGPGAILEWVPDHTIPSAGAALRQSFDVEVDDGARLILIDAFAAGRVARGEAWRFALLDSTLTVRDARGLLLHDRFVLRGGADWDRLGLAEGRPYFATIVLVAEAGLDAFIADLPDALPMRRRHGGRGPSAAPRSAGPLPGPGCALAVGGPRLRLDTGPRPPARSAPAAPSQALAGAGEARERQASVADAPRPYAPRPQCDLG